MQAIALVLLKKMAPYLIVLAVGLTAGVYIGYRVESARLAAARAALAQQQDSDAKAAAAANAEAAGILAKAQTNDNAAETQLADGMKSAERRDAVLTRQIDTEVKTVQHDAPDAPVLAHVLDALGGAQ